MSDPAPHPLDRAAFASATLASVAAGLVGCAFLGLAPGRPPRPPFGSGDGLFHTFVIDTITRTGSYGTDPRIGAPFGTSLLDFPMLERVHVAVIELLGLVVRDPFALHTTFLALAFPAAAFTGTLASARYVRSRPLAGLVGFVFAILPFHFLRLFHSFLASYAVVPYYAVLALDLATHGDAGTTSRRARLARAAGLLFASGAGLYYAYFGSFLVVAAGLRACVRDRRARPLLRAAGYVAILAFGIAWQAFPTLAHQSLYGDNPSVASRSPAESETYALKPIELLLPTRFHRVRALDDLALAYRDSTPLSNENTTASLGMLGSLGVLLALGRFLLGRDADGTRPDPGRELGYLIVACLLFACIGGLASIVAHLGVTPFRAVNRISVVVGFLALLLLAVAIDPWLRAHRRRKPITAAIVVLAALLAGFDQMPRADAFPPVDPRFPSHDRAVVAAIASNVGPRADCLVLPYVRFPEGAQRAALDPYAPLGLVLASHGPRFSYGAMAGRASDLWLRGLSYEPLARVPSAAARAGFDAIVVLRDGYRDRGAAVDAALRPVLGPPILDDATTLVFRIAPRIRAEGRPYVAVALHDGFHGWEWFEESGAGSWSTGDASLELVHHGARAEPVTLEFVLGSPEARRVVVSYRGHEVGRFDLAPMERQRVAIQLEVVPGASLVRLTTDRAAVRPAEGDRRAIAFGIADTHAIPR